MLVYSRNPEWSPIKLPRTEAADSIYSNPDNDSRGDWIPGDPFASKPYSKGQYTLTGPTRRQFSPPPGRFWRISEEKLRELGACRAWGVASENRPQRGQFLPDLQPHSPAMGQKDGEKWTAAVDSQPTLPKPDRLLDADGRVWWGPKRDARPSIKRFLSEVADLTPRTLWKKEDVPLRRGKSLISG